MRHNPGQYNNWGDTCWSNAAKNRWAYQAVAEAVAVYVTGLMSIMCVGFAGWSVVHFTAEPRHSGQVRVDIRKLSFAPPAELTRADLYAMSTVANPRAVLLLCPGFNGNGEDLIRQPVWQEFARLNHLALCAISFASPGDMVQSARGYYYTSRGSGELLFSGLRSFFGRDLPIFAYGFSGGAHFTASLVNWQPARVLGWCADSAAWWEEPAACPAALPPGIVACGDEDASHYGASLTFFAKGRALGRPWTWVSLGGLGHARSESLDRFVRAYFAAIMRGVPDPEHDRQRHEADEAIGGLRGCWRDVDTKEELSARQAAVQPTLACWLPDESLAPLWSCLHRP